MTAHDIAQLRLRAQGLLDSISDAPADVVRWLGAVQAQDYLGTLWTIGQRTRGATERTVERAIADRQIVRTWFMRGTLHFVATEDLRWMIALMGPRMRRIVVNGARQNGAELDEETFAKSNVVITQALSDGTQRTRAELAEALERSGIPANAPRLSYLLNRAHADGLICYGPRRGKQMTHVLVDEWVPSSKKLSRDEALAEFARRYFQGHGPATVDDYAWWSGLTLTQAREGVTSLTGLASETVGGRTYYWPERVRDTPAGGSTGARLLWGFDEYIVAYKDRSAIFSEREIQRARALGGGMMRPVVVLDGRAVANWRRTLAATRVTVEVDYFEKASAAQRRAVSSSAEEFGRFLELPVVLVENV